MKVGIITFHRGTNYGGTLQAFAMQEAVKELGHDAEVIDYWPVKRRMAPIWRGWNTGGGLSGVFKRLLQIHHGSACLREFEKFRDEHLRTSNPVHTQDELNSLVGRYDAVITGSDQVWNFKRSPAYFLNFNKEFMGRRISYAACCTQREQPADLISEVAGFIDRFAHVSVRDSFSAAAIHDATGRVPEIVCDPTLLMRQDWMVPSPPPGPSEILTVYRIGRPMPRLNDAIAMIKQMAECNSSTGIVASTSNPHFSRETDEAFFNLPPADWVRRIYTSRFLFTDSYHGVLFALRMGVPFLACTAEVERSPRMHDLAERFQIANRMISSYDEVHRLDWEAISQPPRVSETIKEHIKNSWRFLRNSLS